jgi:histone deacetylase complex subunit SAP130
MPDTPPPRPDSRNDDAGSSSSGSTTLSATSSPGIPGDRANLSGGDGEEQTMQPSPRKKPRKQTLSSNSVRPGSEQQWGSSENDGTEVVKRKMAKNLSNRMQENSGNQSGMHHRTISPPPRKPSSNYIKDKPHMSLLNSYRHTWKSRHNHFLRHSDVRPRGDSSPTVNELANQKYIMQKINGWKIYHLTSQMEDVIDMENELTSRLSTLQKKLDKNALNEVSKDVTKVQELIKANLQRSKVIQDQVKESKDHALELFEHKSRVSDILHKYMSKRTLKKRDVKMS